MHSGRNLDFFCSIFFSKNVALIFEKMPHFGLIGNGKIICLNYGLGVLAGVNYCLHWILTRNFRLLQLSQGINFRLVMSFSFVMQWVELLSGFCENATLIHINGFLRMQKKRQLQWILMTIKIHLSRLLFWIFPHQKIVNF